MRHVIEDNVTRENVWIAAEALLPHGRADDGDLGAAVAVLICSEGTTESRLNAEHREEVRGDTRAIYFFRRVGAYVEVGIACGCNVSESAIALLPRTEI